MKHATKQRDTSNLPCELTVRALSTSKTSQRVAHKMTEVRSLGVEGYNTGLPTLCTLYYLSQCICTSCTWKPRHINL